MAKRNVMQADRTNRTQRGATLTGYALVVALLAVATLSAIDALQGETGNALVATGSQIGSPRKTLDELANNPNPPAAIDPQNPPAGNLPDPADLFNPPPPLSTPAGYGFTNVSYQGGYASSTLDLDPDSAIPYQSDTFAFLFNEGGTTVGPGFTVPNPVVAPPYVEVCSVYLHYTPAVSGNTLNNIAVTVPGEILGYAESNSELDSTDTWIDGSNPAGGIDFASDRDFSDSEESSIAITGGNTLSITSLTENNNRTDALRIFYVC